MKFHRKGKYNFWRTDCSFKFFIPTHECKLVVKEFKKFDVNIELIDLRSIKPIDKESITKSVNKTKNLVIVDGSWKNNSITANISSIVYEELFGKLKNPILRINLPDCPAPAARTLEEAYYINSKKIISEIKRAFKFWWKVYLFFFFLIIIFPLWFYLYSWYDKRFNNLFFLQKIGINFKKFRCISLDHGCNAEKTKVDSTSDDDPRITSLGKFFENIKSMKFFNWLMY